MAITQQLAVALLAVAAAADVATRRVPNALVVAVMLVGLTGTAAASLLACAIGLAVAAALLGGMLMLWRRGIFGGGDVKLMVAASTCVPPARIPVFLGAIAIAGGVLAVGVAARARLPAPAMQYPVRCTSVPYAPAIAAAVIVALF